MLNFVLLNSSYTPPSIPQPSQGFSWSSFFSTFWDGLVNALNVLTGGLVNLLRLFSRVGTFLYDVATSMHDLANGNGFTVDSGVLQLDEWFGAIRFITGDVVYVEIYILIMIGMAFMAYKTSVMAFGAIKYLLNALWYFFGDIIQNLGIGSIFRNIFNFFSN